jgi:hypothetical protein
MLIINIQAIVMSLPTVESSFATHTTKGIQGFNHPDYPVLRVAAEVLNATESFLWVCSTYRARCMSLILVISSVIFVDRVWLTALMFLSTQKLDCSVSHCIAYVYVYSC